VTSTSIARSLSLFSPSPRAPVRGPEGPSRSYLPGAQAQRLRQEVADGRPDPASGLAWAGGYVGEGVAAANLAARTLRDLILGERTALTALPWVGHEPRRWEPEPLRWASIHAVYSLYRRADRIEQRTKRPSRLGGLVDTVSGRV
jgi:hypothetical protein